MEICQQPSMIAEQNVIILSDRENWIRRVPADLRVPLLHAVWSAWPLLLQHSTHVMIEQTRCITACFSTGRDPERQGLLHPRHCCRRPHLPSRSRGPGVVHPLH